ncbi:MAG: hypothetical protein RIC89_15490, partial [Pseudomonadales bacterium]
MTVTTHERTIGVVAFCVFAMLGSTAPYAFADDVVADDLIVQRSLCAGVDCADGEEFDFDTIRLKSSDPILQFLDTSNSGSFPSNDW